MQRICLAIVVLFSITISAYGQGKPGVLRCSFRGSLDIHASRQPDSPTIARLDCGAAVLLIDDRFGSPHVRTEDGKDGYIIGLNLGQWSIDTESAAPATPASSVTSSAPVPTAVNTPPSQVQIGVPAAPSAPEGFPRVEVFGGYSFIRPDIPGDLAPGGGDAAIQSILGNVLGWGASATVNLNHFFGITGEASAYYKTFTGSILGVTTEANLNLYTFLGGPTFKMRRGAVEPFGHVLVGVGRPGAKATITDDFSSDSTDFHETGLVIAGGGGVDIVVNDRVGIRGIQADYFPYRTSSGDTFTFNNFRWSSGITFRFGH